MTLLVKQDLDKALPDFEHNVLWALHNRGQFTVETKPGTKLTDRVQAIIQIEFGKDPAGYGTGKLRSFTQEGLTDKANLWRWECAKSCD